MGPWDGLSAGTVSVGTSPLHLPFAILLICVYILLVYLAHLHPLRITLALSLVSALLSWLALHHVRIFRIIPLTACPHTHIAPQCARGGGGATTRRMGDECEDQVRRVQRASGMGSGEQGAGSRERGTGSSVMYSYGRIPARMFELI